MRKSQTEFLKELENVLEENKHLKQSAVIPHKAAPVAEWIVFHPVITLVVVSFLLTLSMFMFSPEKFLQIVEVVLFI